jgi:hypothetical protein
MLNTGRPCTGTAEHTEDELENRSGLHVTSKIYGWLSDR